MISKDKLTLILLPFAGGNAYSYRDMLSNLQTTYDVLMPELPGRGALSNQPLIDDANQLADYLINHVIKPLASKPYIIYGHSMGGLLIYVIAQKLLQSGLTLPKHLIISGRNAPCFKRERQVHGYPSTTFWSEINAMGGLPKALLENRELQAYFEPIIRNDFKLVETYHYIKPDNIFDLPMTVFYGDQDHMTKESVEAWQQENKQPVKFIEMKGNHFFIFNHVTEITNYINSLASL